MADVLESPLASVPCRHHRDGHEACYGHIRGSAYLANAPSGVRAGATTALGPSHDSEFHVRRHSSVYTVLFGWQHLSPTGRVVLHLELELKGGMLRIRTPSMN